jgi:hypothetical protein
MIPQTCGGQAKTRLVFRKANNERLVDVPQHQGLVRDCTICWSAGGLNEFLAHASLCPGYAAFVTRHSGSQHVFNPHSCDADVTKRARVSLCLCR